jgi:AcrR family transcriptional regulator
LARETSEAAKVVAEEPAGACCEGSPCAGGFPPPWEGIEEGRGERRDAAENRRRVLAVARDLFAERGVDRVSMHEIAKAAGIGQGTLYRRYAHKGLVCMALLDENFRRLHDRVGARLADTAEPSLAQLDYFLTNLLGFVEENASLLGAVADAACGERRGADRDNPFHAWMHGTATALLERAVASGEIPPLDIPPAADTFLAVVAIDHYLHQRHQRGYPAERILASMRRILFDGLRG